MQFIESTIETLQNLFEQGWVVSCGLSGKDSLCVAHCAVEGLKRAHEADSRCMGRLHLVTTNTTQDNFSVHAFIMQVHQAANLYADEFNLPIITKELQPELFSRPMVEYIGRGKLLRTAQTSVRGRDCAIDWKIAPATKYMRELKAYYQTDKIVGISGVRDQESTVRKSNIEKRGESISVIAQTEMGFTLAPIRNWTLQDVWSLIGAIESDKVESFINEYSDLAKGIRKHYAAGNSGTCEVFTGDNKSASKACGARFGCLTCSMVAEDKSLQSQIQTEPSTYGFMSPFVELRRFMNDTLFDMERSRSLLGREILHGRFIKIGYNQYSLEYRKELLRYVTTIDAREYEAATALGIKPRFELITPDTLIAIQYHWAREGGESFAGEAIAIWHDIRTHGKRFDIPKTHRAGFTPKALNFSNLSYIHAENKHEYRYADINELKTQFDGAIDCDFNGFVATRAEQAVLTCNTAKLDDVNATVTPFTETSKALVNELEAETFIMDSWFDLAEDGYVGPDSKGTTTPDFMLRLLLAEGLVTLRKGGLNRLNKDLKRAQVYNAIAWAAKRGNMRYVEHIILARSISETEFNQRVSEQCKQEESKLPQLQLAI